MEASACSIEETAQVGGGLGVVDVEVDTRGGGALSGMADADHLRIGEDHVRRLRAICAVGDRGLVAQDVVDGDPRLVLAYVRELRPAGDVAGRVQPRHAAHAHVLVDLEKAAGVEPDDLEPDVVSRCPAPDRDEHLVRLGRSVVGRRDDVRVAVPAEPYDAPARADLDAVLLEGGRQLNARELLVVREHPQLALDERDLAAQLLECLCHLQAHRPRADDDQPARDLVGHVHQPGSDVKASMRDIRCHRIRDAPVRVPSRHPRLDRDRADGTPRA